MRLLILFFLAIFFSSASAEVEVFTLDGWKPDYADSVYNLRAGTKVKQDLNEKLKRMKISNVEDVKKYVTQDFQDAISNEVRSLALAAKYRLRYLPAVVIDGKYVMYGKPSKSQVLHLGGSGE